MGSQSKASPVDRWRFVSLPFRNSLGDSADYFFLGGGGCACMRAHSPTSISVPSYVKWRKVCLIHELTTVLVKTMHIFS